MPGRGPAPKPQRQRRRDEKRRVHQWRSAEGTGWQHGPIPELPGGLMPDSQEAWRVWFSAWFAAHWTPADVVGLRIVVLLHDAVRRGEYQRAGEFRLWADTYGITPKGQLERRWQRPESKPDSAPQRGSDPYSHLRLLDQE